MNSNIPGWLIGLIAISFAAILHTYGFVCAYRELGKQVSQYESLDKQREENLLGFLRKHGYSELADDRRTGERKKLDVQNALVDISKKSDELRRQTILLGRVAGTYAKELQVSDDLNWSAIFTFASPQSAIEQWLKHGPRSAFMPGYIQSFLFVLVAAWITWSNVQKSQLATISADMPNGAAQEP